MTPEITIALSGILNDRTNFNASNGTNNQLPTYPDSLILELFNAIIVDLQTSQAAFIALITPAPVVNPTPVKIESINNTLGVTVIDTNGSVWTLDGTATLKDGQSLGQGQGTQYLYLNHIVYVLGTDNNWYSSASGSWTNVGAEQPS